MQTFAVKHKDNEIRAKSRSGGMFTAVSDYIFDHNGVVYGCVMDTQYSAKHIRAISKEDRDRMRGSKYIQSALGDTFSSVRKDLNDGVLVLFTGTPCQVAGLKKYLGKDYDNLLSLDILCHSVPSPKVWEAYVRWNEKKYKTTVKAADFRDKSEVGWRDHVETLWFDNGKKTTTRVFRNIFCSVNIARKSCYECRFKNLDRPGDITIGDYWGIEKNAPEFDDNKGVSLVLVNTEKGQKVFQSIMDDIDRKETSIETSMSSALICSYPEPKERAQFWKDFESKDFSYIAKKYGGLLPAHKKMLRKIKKTVKKVLPH